MNIEHPKIGQPVRQVLVLYKLDKYTTVTVMNVVLALGYTIFYLMVVSLRQIIS